MQVVLQIRAVADRRKRLWLRQNQEARVGRTDWADFVVADDPSLADVHFKLACQREACWLTDLSRSPGTYVNGVRVVERTLADGDEIRAGRTQFDVAIDVGPKTSASRPLANVNPAFRYASERSPAELSVYRSLDGCCGPVPVVKSLGVDSQLYLVVNYRRLGLPVPPLGLATADLLEGLPEVVRSHHSLTLVPVPGAFPIDQFLAGAWGRDAVSIVRSSLTSVDLAASLRHAAPSFLSTGLLRKQLLTAPATFARQLVAGIQAVLVEAESPGSWIVFADPDAAPTWQHLGFPAPPTA